MYIQRQRTEPSVDALVICRVRAIVRALTLKASVSGSVNL